MNEELTCQELVELVTEYFEGTMPAEERVRFEGHLEECDPCSNYVNQVRRTIQLAGRLTEESIPPEAMDELMHAFRSWKAGGP